MSAHNLIPSTEYEAWVYNWKKQEHITSPYSFFLKEKNVQTGMAFDFDSIRYLFSTTGIATVKIRFGLREFSNGENPQFHLILFGADKDNQVITPFFTSSGFTYNQNHPVEVVAEGNLPQVLMKEWEKDWHHKVVEGSINQEMFKIRYGFLQGYNYPIQEMMAALGTFKNASTIHISFGLHKYFSMYETPDPAVTFIHTFGLMLYAAQPADSSADASSRYSIIEESGYYDLTAPCPQTC